MGKGIEKGFAQELLDEIERFQKTKIPRCTTCKKNYTKVGSHIWKPTCEHNPDLKISIGG